MRQLVDDHHLGRPRDDRVEVHLLQDAALVDDRATRHHLESGELLLRVPSAVGLDIADDEVGPPVDPAAGLVEHRVGLTDPRRRTEVDPQVAALHGLSLPARWHFAPRG